jgi:hypothetical protein
MATPVQWLLNLDADRELEAPARYAPDPAIEARIAELAARMTMLLRPGDVFLGHAPPRPELVTLPFCPTPSARARLKALGLHPHFDVPLAVLRHVNDRAFCAALGQTLPHAEFVRDMAQLEALVRAPSAPEVLVLKRAFGFAGRARRQVRGGVLDASTRGFAARSFRAGEGLQVEPWLTRQGDFACHGWLGQRGDLLTGPVVSQRNDEMGRWQASELAADQALTPDERAALYGQLSRTGDALSQAGYHGPFGVDAFRYVLADGSFGFQPRSEVNARFTMGYPRALLERALSPE